MSRLEDQIAFVTDERVFLKKLFADYIKLKKKVQKD